MSATRLRFRRQRPVRGGRIPLPSCVLKDIYREVDKLARRYNCSRSFVIATALADTFGIDEDVQERFYREVKKESK